VRLILGLGNPGAEYQRTRHNVGFAVVEELARRHRFVLDQERRRSRFGVGRIAGQPVVLAQPLTFMNLAGAAARLLLAHHGLAVADLVVVHDDADFPPGVVRLKLGGGSAGHRGLLSIVEQLGAADFIRVRIGIGRPATAEEALEDFVLDLPTQAEAELIGQGVQKAADAVEVLLRDGLEAAMRAHHRTE
jgi:PTH1 family peptidyl-tRNA hydrolase